MARIWGLMIVEAAAGSEAAQHWSPRARFEVWPGCRHVPGIVAPDGRGARGAECSALDIPRRPPPWRKCAMDTIYSKVAGLDVHLKSIQVAVRCRQETGKLFQEVRSFGTMTRDLRALADYLESLGVTHVAMEATGVLWKPVWNILDGRFTLLLGQPPAPQEGSGAEERRDGCGMDCPVVAVRFAAGQFRAAASGPGTAGLDASPGAVGRRAHAGGQPHPQVAGGLQHQAGRGGLGRVGQVGAGHVAGVARGASKTRSNWRIWRWACCGRSFRNCGWPWKATAPSITVSCWGGC